MSFIEENLRTGHNDHTSNFKRNTYTNSYLFEFACGITMYKQILVD